MSQNPLLLIEDAIQKMEGGEFQRLCSAYLYKKGYEDPVNFGSEAATNKSVKGIPDVRFRLKDGHTALVMFAGGETYRISKAQQDVDDCLLRCDLRNVKEIVECFSSTKINQKDLAGIEQECAEKGIVFHFFGLDAIAMDIRYRYKDLAVEYLGIALAEPQLMSSEDFIIKERFQGQGFDLERPLLGREKEREDFQDLLDKKNLIVITGDSGIGKTRFALDTCQDFSRKEGYGFQAMISSGADPYDEIIAALNEHPKLLLLIDDASAFANLSQIFLILLDHHFFSRLKIVMSIRESKKKDFLKQMDDRLDIAPFILTRLSDETIEKIILAEDCSLADARKIEEIAAGNPRNAIMACAIVKSGKEVPSSIADLYQHYLSEDCASVMASLSRNEVAALLEATLFPFVDVSSLDPYRPLLDYLHVEEDDFRDALDELEKHEILDLESVDMYTIHDQALRNYLLYRLFCQEARLCLKDLLILLYPAFPTQLTNALSSLCDVFSGEKTQTKVKEAILGAWEPIVSGDSEVAFKFVQEYSRYNPIGAGEFALDYIASSKSAEYPPGLYFEDNQIALKADPIYQWVLDAFFASGETKYLQPYLDSIASTGRIKEGYASAMDSLRFYPASQTNYSYLNLFLDELFSQAQKGKESLVCLALRLCAFLLEFDYEEIALETNGNLIANDLPLTLSDSVFAFRKRCWDYLGFASGEAGHQSLVKEVLRHYFQGSLYSVGASLAKAEASFVDVIINNCCLPSSFEDCILVETYSGWLKNLKHPSGIDLTPFWDNPYFRYCRQILPPERLLYATDDRLTNYLREHVEPTLFSSDPKQVIDFAKGISEGIRTGYHADTLLYLINVLLDEGKVNKTWQLSFLDACLLFKEAAHGIQSPVIEHLIQNQDEAVICSALTAYLDRYPDLFIFFASAACNLYPGELRKAIQLCQTNVMNYPSFDLLPLLRYEKKDPMFFVDTFREMANPAVPFAFLFTDFLRGDQISTSDFVAFFNGDVSLAFNVYRQALVADVLVDCYGKHLHYFIQQDPHYFEPLIPLMYRNRNSRELMKAIWQWPEAGNLLDMAFDASLNRKGSFAPAAMFQCFVPNSLNLSIYWSWASGALSKRGYSKPAVQVIFAVIRRRSEEDWIFLLKLLLACHPDPSAFAGAFHAIYFESYFGKESQHLSYLISLFRPFEQELRLGGYALQADLVLQRCQELENAKVKQEKKELFGEF